jgi:SAM-dependent methyltransferase
MPIHTTLFCRERAFDPGLIEMMDRPQPVSEELRVDLENLRKLNESFGSYSLIRFFLNRWCKRDEELVLVDLCTGFGDIPRLAVDWCRRHGVKVRILAVDSQPATLEIARERSGGYPEIQFIKSDVFEFTDPGDLVFCSLALHHFSDGAAVRLVRQIGLMARKGALVADLERTDLTILGIHLLTMLIIREPMTRFDARVSIRRAFSFQEMKRVGVAAGWDRLRHRRFPVSRQAIWKEI